MCLHLRLSISILWKDASQKAITDNEILVCYECTIWIERSSALVQFESGFSEFIPLKIPSLILKANECLNDVMKVR